MKSLELSALPHTWLIDIDGTIFLHNGHLIGDDQVLPGVREFWSQIPACDLIILLSARAEDQRNRTIQALMKCGLRFDKLILDLPHGERLIVNDRKRSGLNTAIAINVERDAGLLDWELSINRSL
jgi:hypothetical protein